MYVRIVQGAVVGGVVRPHSTCGLTRVAERRKSMRVPVLRPLSLGEVLDASKADMTELFVQ